MGDTYGLGQAFDDYMLDNQTRREAYKRQSQVLFWTALGFVVTGLVVLSFGSTVLAVALLAIGVFFGQGSSRYAMLEETMAEYYYLARLIAEKKQAPADESSALYILRISTWCPQGEYRTCESRQYLARRMSNGESRRRCAQ
jgi:hypothetical protein